MNTGRVWLLAVGLILVLLLAGVVYFLWPASSSVIPASMSPSVATQTPVLNTAPKTDLSAQSADTTLSTPVPISSGSTPVYRYNAQGQLQVIIYHDGSTYSYEYNPHGDKIRETTQTGKTWSYIYNQSHRLISGIDPNGRISHREDSSTAQ